MSYDVVIAGGSVAGLLCAREVAEKGFSVLVIEEDYEIGTPEHCGGLVSLSGLEELGIIPFRKTFDHMIESVKISSPNGKNFTIDSKKQKVIEISRRKIYELDKQILDIFLIKNYCLFLSSCIFHTVLMIPCSVFMN